MTTKILALADALGNLVRFVLLPGQRYDTLGVPPLIDGIAFDALTADKAFDSNWIIAELDERGAKAVISQHPRRAQPLPLDEEMYKWRHLIENFFAKLRSSNGSPCAPTRPTRASQRISISPAPSSTRDDSQQTLDRSACCTEPNFAEVLNRALGLPPETTRGHVPDEFPVRRGGCCSHEILVQKRAARSAEAAPFGT